MATATLFQDFACLGTLFLFALVSANTRNTPLRGNNLVGAQLLQAELMEAERQFHQFQADFQKNYATEEERLRRFEVYRNNMKKAQKLNELEEGTAEYGATFFADLTSEESGKYFTGLKFKPELENEVPLPMAEIPEVDLPEEFDWRHFNVVTTVKDQGNCSSCWAFSVTGNIESLYAIKHGKLLSLSKQQLVDCDESNFGCEGGLLDRAYEAIKKMGGLELENDYPYVDNKQECNFDKNLVKVKISSYLSIPSNETSMAKWLVKNGPISIGINPAAMEYYKGGISHPQRDLCHPDFQTHAVTIIGFGVHRDLSSNKTIPFWIIKNSSGPNWGEQGYYRIYRGDGSCGVDRQVYSAVIA